MHATLGKPFLKILDQKKARPTVIGQRSSAADYRRWLSRPPFFLRIPFLLFLAPFLLFFSPFLPVVAPFRLEVASLAVSFPDPASIMRMIASALRCPSISDGLDRQEPQMLQAIPGIRLCHEFVLGQLGVEA